MRAAAALTGILAAAALLYAWRMSLSALEAQAKVDAAQQISAAEQVMALREDKRLETLVRAASELAPTNLFAPEDVDQLREKLLSTSFKESLNSSILVDDKGVMHWANGKPQGGMLQLDVIGQALDGAPAMALLQSNDPALVTMRQLPYKGPSLVAAAPVFATTSRDVVGAVVVVEPVTPEFFHHLAQLTKVGVSFSTADGELGVVPKEAMAVGRELTFVDGEKLPVFAQRIDFRARGAVLGEAVAAVEAGAYKKRAQRLHPPFILGLAAVVAVTLLQVRRRP